MNALSKIVGALQQGSAIENAGEIANASIITGGGAVSMSGALIAASHIWPNVINPANASDIATVLLFVVGALQPLIHMITSRVAGFAPKEVAQ